ncbi:hypothetical protein PHMEG_0004928 [Phytophthora megakarya]|uniref:Reverse transcriptase n=1 Tax=Phytophthora megakarya TaxID=4795 RepID=A0A225WU80_9STRA|nr:hypothetical protein PHMEG_0004928 [Phytophthora megakarya]
MVYLLLELPVALRWGSRPSSCGSSTHDALPALDYEPIRRLVLRIDYLTDQNPRCLIKILEEDVNSVFRLIPVSHGMATYCAESRRDRVIIDMGLPLGWTESPAHYGDFGEAITFLVSRESPMPMDPVETDDERFV